MAAAAKAAIPARQLALQAEREREREASEAAAEAAAFLTVFLLAAFFFGMTTWSLGIVLKVEGSRD